MANDDGTFGFEDLQKAFNRIEQKYENKTDAMLMAMANTARQRVRSKTPTGKNKEAQRLMANKKPKTFGKSRVARIQTENRYGHVVEEGHKVVTGGSTVGRNGRKLNVLQRGIRGVSVGGKTKAEKMIENTVKNSIPHSVKMRKKLLDDLTREVEL